MSRQAVLDKIMAKAISRKLFTFLTATGAIDAMKEYRHG